MNFDFLSEVTVDKCYEYKYSIGSLVTRMEEYHEMVDSFITAGFNKDECEFLFINNTHTNSTDAYQGINLLLDKAKGQYIIICHQDILINKDKRTNLDQQLAGLDRLDPKWAVCGNAGAAGPNYIVYHISYPNDVFKHKGNFPLKVSSLDENFLLVKNSARLALSSDLSGFHLYGTDLCLNAELRGYNSYAIAFNLIHKSYGNRDKNFYAIRKKLIHKYDRFFRARWIQSPSTVFHLSGSLLARLSANPVSLFIVRMINGLKKRRNGR